MPSMTISEVAGRTGFSSSALRFYERAGLVVPGRSESGYRLYDDDDLIRLRFIARAKRLGLTLEEIADVVPLLDAERCEPVQQRLRSFVEDKIDDARRRSVDLAEFLDELQQVAARLGEHTPDGACDDRCGCTSEPAAAEPVMVAMAAGRRPLPAQVLEVPIVCSLGAGEREGRVADWHGAIANAVDREAIEGGVRVRFARTVDVPALAGLMAAEQTCCAFFTLNLTITRDAVILDVTAPDDGIPLVHELVGAPA